VNFRLLQMRLVSDVRARVRNGELSERGLARLTGISQPHIHNVLKETRLLSTEMADQILRHLRINLVDLLTAEDGDAPGVTPKLQEACECRSVALLDGWLGREYPYPQAAGRELYPFPAVRLDPDAEGYFALDLSGGATIGSVRRALRHLYLWDLPAQVWQSIPLTERGPLDVIQGRVSLVVREL